MFVFFVVVYCPTVRRDLDVFVSLPVGVCVFGQHVSSLMS